MSRASLNRVLLFCAGLVVLSASVRGGEPAPAGGGEKGDQASALKMDPVVVTATRRSMLFSDVPDVLRVVTRRDLEETNPSSVGEVLEYLPGVSVETGTGSGLPKRSVIGLGGLPPQYTVVLVNGVRLLSEHIHTGQNIEMIAPQSIERIEVIRGAASAQYGADAIGGVVNIITRQCGKEPKTSVGVAGGSYNTYEADVSIFQPASDRVRVAMFARREESDGVVLQMPLHRLDNMGYERHIGMVRADADLTEDTRVYGWVNGVDNTADWQGADADSYLLMMALGGSHRITPELELNVKFSYSDWEAEVSTEKNQLFQADSHAIWQINDQHVLTGGLELRYNEFKRSAAMDIPDQDAYGVFLQHEWKLLDDLTVMAAIRLDDVERVDDVAVSPKISVLYSPESLPLRLRGSISRGFHAPTLQELYEEGYGHGGAALRFGNRDLDPEYSMTYSMGAEYMPFERLQLVAYAQYSDIDDMIIPVYEGAWSVNPTKDVWRRDNIEHAWVFSGEITARYAVNRNLRLETGYTFTDNEDEENGHQLPFDPGEAIFAKAFGEVALNSEWKLSGFVGLRSVFERSAWSWKPPAGAPTGDPSGMTTDLRDNEKLDAGIDLAFRKSFSIYVNVYNILEQDLENLDDSFTKTEGEMTFKLGVRWDF